MTNPKDIIGATKPPLHLVPGAAMVHMAMALKAGADEYGEANWRDDKIKSNEYISAAMRHLVRWQDGDDNDKKSGLSHLAHVLAGIGILIDAIENESVIDTRRKHGPASKTIEKFTKQPTAIVGDIAGWQDTTGHGE